jgi:hypothetical protein
MADKLFWIFIIVVCISFLGFIISIIKAIRANIKKRNQHNGRTN